VLRSTVRGILGLVLVAAATWLADYVTERIFGPDDAGADA
jgi:thiol:disulfide interchange protein